MDPQHPQRASSPATFSGQFYRALRILLALALVEVYGGMGSAAGQMLRSSDASHLSLLAMAATTLLAHVWYERYLQNLLPLLRLRRGLQIGAWLLGLVLVAV